MSGMIDDAAGIEPRSARPDGGADRPARDARPARALEDVPRRRLVVALLGLLRDLRLAADAARPARAERSVAPGPAELGALVRHRPARPRRLLARDRRRADMLSVAPLATLLGIVAGTIVGLVTGYFGGARRRRRSAAIIDAVLALPLIVIAVARARRARQLERRR